MHSQTNSAELNIFDFDFVFRNELNKIKELPIYGCITGSCMLGDRVNFNAWDERPDIDIFIYSESAMLEAVTLLEMDGYTLGGKGKNPAGEELKRQWIRETGVRGNFGLSTLMLEKKVEGHDVYVNVTWKKDCKTVAEVICSYDMSIVMKGFDIPHQMVMDLTNMDGRNPQIAVPNYLSNNIEEHPSRFTLNRALRQWDRIIKYYQRGFDTRPMAQYYLDKINEVLAAGAIFGSEAEAASIEKYFPGFVEMKGKIETWMEEHCDD